MLEILNLILLLAIVVLLVIILVRKKSKSKIIKYGDDGNYTPLGCTGRNDYNNNNVIPNSVCLEQCNAQDSDCCDAVCTHDPNNSDKYISCDSSRLTVNCSEPLSS